MKMIKINRVVVGNDGKYRHYGEVRVNTDYIVCIENAMYKVDNAFAKEDKDYEKFKQINPDGYFADIQIRFGDKIESFISVESPEKVCMFID